MKNNKIVAISFLFFLMFACQSSSAQEAGNMQKSVSGLAGMIMPFVESNNTTMTIAIINGNGYTSLSDWNAYICPALKQVGASKSFCQYIAYTMGFAKTPKNKMYICKG